jgi:LemA protein
MIWLIVLIVIAVVLVGIVIALYNRLVRLRNRAENAWAQVDVQLRRRYDLIPNLVEAVKGYAAHERGTFEEVTKARTAAQQAKGVQEQAQAENMLTQAIGRLFAVAEAYPELRATENFQQLSRNLSELEDEIQASRRIFNSNVQHYNTRTQQFPTMLIAGTMSFAPREFFEIEAPAERAVPQVAF